MNRRLSSVALLALLIVVSDARDARACSCMTGTPLCETLWKTPVVFAGEVIDITDVPGGFDSRLPENRRVTFRVEQSWREDVPREVHVRTGSGGGDCGYPFIKGVRYLVFAHRNGEQLTTTICSPTKPISDAGEDLEYLKTASKPSVAGRVFGRVTFQRSDPDAPAMPLKGYALTLSDGRKERSTKTDADGRYEFNGVSTGVYGVRLDVPSTERAYGKKEVELVDPRGCAAADFYVVFDGRISARLVRADGQPAGGQTLEAVTLESLQETDRFPSSRPKSTSSDGRVEIPELAPGRYVVGLGITQRMTNEQPYGQVLYPGVRDVASAQVIDLGPGERVDLGDFVLPRPLPPQTLTGIVVGPDGAAAGGATVVLWTVRDGRTRASSSSTTADGEGKFTFPAFLGERYQLTVFVSPSDGRAQWTARSADFELTRETAHQKLTLERRQPR